MLHKNVIEKSGFRTLTPAELEVVSGGFDDINNGGLSDDGGWTSGPQAQYFAETGIWVENPIVAQSLLSSSLGSIGFNEGSPEAAVCPVDEWWNPNIIDDAGDIKDLPGNGTGPFERYWTDGYTWCFYDSNNNSMGRYVVDSNGGYKLGWSTTDGTPSGGITGWGFGINGSMNDSNGYSFTVTLRPIG